MPLLGTQAQAAVDARAASIASVWDTLFLGNFDADTPDPNIQDASGVDQTYYRCLKAGSHDSGAGAVAYILEDQVLHDSGTFGVGAQPVVLKDVDQKRSDRAKALADIEALRALQ